jgi:hypothetical protein
MGTLSCARGYGGSGRSYPMVFLSIFHPPSQSSKRPREAPSRGSNQGDDKLQSDELYDLLLFETTRVPTPCSIQHVSLPLRVRAP